MEGTLCSPQDCKFVKAKFCKKCEDCPFYVETWWQDSQGTPKLVKDCFPKRTMLMQAEMVNRILSTQSANEQARNEIHILADVFKKTLDIMKKALPASEKPAGEIENKYEPI